MKTARTNTRKLHANFGRTIYFWHEIRIGLTLCATIKDIREIEMTDKPDTTHPSSVPADNRGLQPGLILTGVFGAFIGLGAVIIASRAAAKKDGQDYTPPAP